MKFRKYRFTTLVSLALLSCFFDQPLYAAERIVQLNIPGCASWGLSERIGSILKTTAGVIKHEMPKENEVNITFNDKKTSVKKIVAALKKGELTVKGEPVLINK